MKHTLRFAPGLLLLLAASPCIAITDTWDGGGADNNIATGLNWLDNTAPLSDLVNTDLIFSGAVRLAPNVGTIFSTNSVTFNNTAGAFTIGGSSVTVGSGGIVNNSANLQTFPNAISLGTASSTLNAASGALVLNGAFGLGTSTLTVPGAANTTLGLVNGTGTINKSGAGTLSFQPATTHLFDLVQTAGTVQTLGATEFNTGSAVQINGGTFSALGNLTLDGATFTRGAGAFTLATGATLTVQNAGSFAFGGSQSFTAGQTIAVASGGQVTSGSYIDLGNGGVGTAFLSVSGSGSLLQTGSINDWGASGGSANIFFTSGSTGTLGGGLRLAQTGAAGGGFMTINLGAQVTTSSLAIGLSTGGAQATVNVDGVGSKLTVSGAGAASVGAATGAAQALSFFGGGSFESGTGALTVGTTGTLNAYGDFLVNGDIIVNGVFNSPGLPITLAAGKNLTVQGGGDAFIQALNVSANSAATFTGAGTTFNNGHIFTTAATSVLNVSAGAVLNNAVLRPTNGSMTCDGAGTQFNVASFGYTGIGGTYNGAAGTATVTFRNNAVGTLADYADVASFGSTGASGTLQVQSGADVQMKNFAIAISLNQTGVVTVDGSGSTITQSGNAYLIVGRFADSSASLQLTNGASFTTGTVAPGSFGVNVEATGTLSLLGTGTTFTANAPMVVRGQVTTGAGTIFTMDAGKSFTVTDGGDAVFGSSPNFGAGTAITVSGAGSTLSSGARLDLDNVRLDVTGGGVVQSAGTMAIYGTSQVVVDGPGSELKTAPAAVSVWVGSAVADHTILTFRNGATGTFGAVEFGQSFTPRHTRVVVESGADVTLTGLAANFTGITTSEVQVSGAGSTLTATTNGIVLGEATDRAGTLTISGGAVVSLPATGTNKLVLNPTGTLNLAGGTLSLGEPVSRLGGVINFTAGAALLAENLAVGPAGLLGANLTLTAAKQVTTPGLTQVEIFNTLTLDGGVLTTGTLENSGTIDFKKGTLAVTGAGGFNIGTGALGANVVLGTGANLQVTNTANVASGALLRTNGGSITAANITNSGTIDHRDGALNFSGTLTNNASSRVFVSGVASPAGAIINSGTITMQNGIGFLGGAGAITSTGFITGDGTIAKPVTNSAAGQIRAESGKRLTFTGTLAPNAGTMSLQGGTLDFINAITNGSSGFISGRGTLSTASLTNQGSMAFSGGNTDIFGDTTNTSGARIVTSGSGAVTTFYDDVVHNGLDIFTGAGCSTVFFGNESGNGPLTGSGSVYFIGDLRPGNSPAAVSISPQAIFAPSSSLVVEIGGLTAGTQYDKITFSSAANLQVAWEGTLVVTLVNGFTPAAGQAFDIFDFDAARDAGTFGSFNLPALPVGLAWDSSQLYTDGTLRVISTSGLNFAQWAATALGNPAATPTGDHDHDGLANAVEYALGLFPAQPGTMVPTFDLYPYGDGKSLRARFTRPLDRTGVTLKIQASSDLLTWTNVAISVNSAPFTGAGFISENRTHPLSDPGLVEVRDILTTDIAPRRLMRLVIALDP